MNPSLKFLMILLISLEISFKSSLITQLFIITGATFYLLIHHLRFRNLCLLLTVPFLAAFTIFATLYWFTKPARPYYAWCLSSRVYVYVTAIACLSQTTTATELARSLEQNFNLPNKFTYGVLAALNLLPRMRQAIKQIRIAAMMRNYHLSFWSPKLYFKAIFVALRSATNLAEGMESHGFIEGQKRSFLIKIPLSKTDWIKFFLLIFLVNVSLFTLK